MVRCLILGFDGAISHGLAVANAMVAEGARVCIAAVQRDIETRAAELDDQSQHDNDLAGTKWSTERYISMADLLCGVWRRPHLGTFCRGRGRPPHQVRPLFQTEETLTGAAIA